MRNPFIDAVRALAVVAVVLGHWLVTSLVDTPTGMYIDSPLKHLSALTPVSWVLQALGLFFFVGGYAAAHSTTPFLVRLKQLAVPTLLMLGCWAAVLFGLVLRGVDQGTAWNIGFLVTTPLWFFGVYLVLLALKPLVRRLDEYSWGVLVPVVLVLVVPYAVWWAAWQLGYSLARRRIPGPPLLVLGVVGYALLTTFGGYPLSAVGIPGEAVSNLNPPNYATLALAFAQIGLVLTIAPLLTRLGTTKPVTWLNKRALGIFLAHQSALITVTLALSAWGPLPGLQQPPDHPDWVWQRLLWLPVCAAVTWGWLRALRGRSPRRAAPPPAEPDPVPASVERTPAR
ncbi:acyltransferase family protein [Lentzea sp. NBC_00516]|uniref:acyltransferase family protein n=1 Tax=Lentzea sp. NBC_00516 TaxID=2903582 RepID=UPI002E801F25|nr:acyltransferase family protein [Lentzea sp. NBC_00516]WUD23845.1 acyltransferase family protein [Lentzea sp. NBC_00516]